MDDLITWLRAIWDARERELDDDERMARAAQGDQLFDGTGIVVMHAATGTRSITLPSHIAHFTARFDPVRVLREVATERADIDAKRRILDRWRPKGSNPHPGLPCINYEGQDPEGYTKYDSCERHLNAPDRTPDHVVQLLALPYAGRDGWREEWTA